MKETVGEEKHARILPACLPDLAKRNTRIILAASLVFTILEPRKRSMKASELHKICWSRVF